MRSPSAATRPRSVGRGVKSLALCQTRMVHMYAMALWFETALLPSGWASHVRLSILDRPFDTIETGVDPDADDQRHAIGLPGLCNVHSHGFQRGMAGLAE